MCSSSVFSNILDYDVLVDPDLKVNPIPIHTLADERLGQGLIVLPF
jgi:hypothetical protein